LPKLELIDYIFVVIRIRVSDLHYQPISKNSVRISMPVIRIMITIKFC